MMQFVAAKKCLCYIQFIPDNESYPFYKFRNDEVLRNMTFIKFIDINQDLEWDL